jgi:hypothetical protein
MLQQFDSKIHWLSFFRVSVAGLCLFNFLSLQADFNLLYSNEAYAPVSISYLLNKSNIIPSLIKIQSIFSDVMPIEYNTLLLIFRIVFIISLILLLLGFYSRITAFTSLLLFLIFHSTYDYYRYGFDCFINIALFYCFIFPVGNYNALTLSKKLIKNTGKYLKILQVHISIAYFFCGFEKILGINWRNGESFWKAIHDVNYTSIIDLNFLANTPFFLILGWATIILEMLYPIFMNIKKTRKIWLFGIIILHLSIALLMGLYFFAAIMIALNITAYYIPYSSSTFDFKTIEQIFNKKSKVSIISN